MVYMSLKFLSSKILRIGETMATGDDLKVVEYELEYPIGVLNKRKRVEKIVIKLTLG